MFWGLGLWGYITSYKGISTNFVLREPSIYQNIVIIFSHLPEAVLLTPWYAHILSKHLKIVNTQFFIKRKRFFVAIYQRLNISMLFFMFLNVK